MTNKNKQTDENKPAVKHCLPLSGIWGILIAFTVASIVYTSYITVMVALNGEKIQWLVVAPVAPQAVFAAWIVIFKFAK